MIRGPKTPSTAERPVCEWYQKSPGPSTTRNLISCLLLSFALFCRGHWWTKATPSYCFFFFFFLVMVEKKTGGISKNLEVEVEVFRSFSFFVKSKPRCS